MSRIHGARDGSYLTSCERCGESIRVRTFEPGPHYCSIRCENLRASYMPDPPTLEDYREYEASYR